jgi:hypothetical protein
VSLQYTYPVTISNNRVVYCKELQYKHIIPVAKYIESDNDTNLCEYFEKLSYHLSDHKLTNLNYLDKFLILMGARIKSIGSYIDVIKSNIKNSIDLKFLCNNILMNFIDISNHCKLDQLTVIYGHPIKINHVDSIYNTINYINVDNTQIYLGDLESIELDEILANIPLAIIRQLYKIHKFRNIQTIDLFEFHETPTVKKKIKFSYRPEDYINLLKLSYTIDVKTINYHQYTCAHKLHIPPSEFDNLTPNDVNAFMKILQEENKSNKTGTSTS